MIKILGFEDEESLSLSTMLSLLNKGRELVPLETKKKYKVWIYTLVVLATSLDNLNVAGTMTIIFSISEYFPNAGTTTISWVFSAYSLTLGAFIILAGKLADVIGPHNVFLVGLFFTAFFALITAVIVKEPIALIVFRAFQGIFASSLIPSTFSMTGNYFQGDALLKALTGFVMSLTTVFGIGCILGGAFSVSSIGYKGLFYFTFAVGMFIFIILFFLIIPIDKTEGHKNLKLKQLDFGGCAALIAGLLLIILGLTEGGQSWKRPAAYVPIIIGGLVVISVFIFEMIYIQRFKDKVNSQITSVHECEINYDDTKKEQDTPSNNSIQSKSEIQGANDWRYKIQLLFPREVISIRNFYQYLASTFLVYINYIAIMTTIIQYYQYITLDSPILTAIKVFPLALGLGVGAMVYRQQYAEKVGTKLVILASPVILLTMGVWLSRLDFRVKNSYWKYECFAQFFIGYGTNLYFSVYWTDIITGTPLHLQGVVSGILQTAGQIGICFGNAIIASLTGDLVLDRSFEARLSLHNKFKKNFYLAFAASGALILVLLTIKRQPVDKVSDEEAVADAEEDQRHEHGVQDQ